MSRRPKPWDKHHGWIFEIGDGEAFDKACDHCGEKIWNPRHALEIHERESGGWTCDIHKRCFDAYILRQMRFTLTYE